MKFVQSFWSKPFDDALNQDNWNYRHNGGFPSAYLFYCSWTYSCLSIKKYYPNLHLITDSKGLYFFKEILGLPYVSFSDGLNALDDYHGGLWALGKLHTYRTQQEPFCHIDGDVFIFGPILDSILDSPVFCQSFDIDTDQYKEIHPYVHSHFKNVPIEFRADLNGDMKLLNAGIIGGHDLPLFQAYTEKAFALIDQNMEKLDGMNTGLFNLYYEQFLLSNMLEKKSISISPLFPKSSAEPNFAAFHDVPQKARYIHLISHLKKSTEFLEQVVARLYLEFPDYYNRLQEVFKKERK
tara:strand:+ start:24728 stop:25612 length:885 start_codon:yes stop_codon:yes gene_type:complete